MVEVHLMGLEDLATVGAWHSPEGSQQCHGRCLANLYTPNSLWRFRQ